MYNIGCAMPVTINDLARRVIEHNGSHSVIEPSPTTMRAPGLRGT